MKNPTKEPSPVKTPLQVAQEAKAEANKAASLEINKILNDNGLTMVIKQTIEIVSKQ